MKITFVLLLAAGCCVASEPQVFSASRSMNRPLAEVKSALKIYWTEARTNHHALFVGDAREEPGRFTQFWMDCAGAPPGALTGEIVLTSEGAASTRLEVRTGATISQDAPATDGRRKRTEATLEEIVGVLSRQR